MNASLGDREEGTILMLTLGLFVVLTLLVSTVVDVSAVFLDRRDLAGECDSAALAGVQAVDPQQLYAGGIGDALPVTQSSGSAAARAVTKALGSGATATAKVVDGALVVHCARTVSLPLGGGHFTVGATSTAESPVG